MENVRGDRSRFGASPSDQARLVTVSMIAIAALLSVLATPRAGLAQAACVFDEMGSLKCPPDVSYLDTIEVSPQGLHAIVQFAGSDIDEVRDELASVGLRLIESRFNDSAWFAFISNTFQLGSAEAILGGAGQIPYIGLGPYDYTVALESRQFVPPEDVSHLSVIQGVPPGRHAIVQFFGNPDALTRRRLAHAGLTLLYSISSDAWVTFVSSAFTRTGFEDLIRFIGPILPSDKVASAILPGPGDPPVPKLGEWAVMPDGKVKLQVEFFADVSRVDAEQAMAGLVIAGRIVVDQTIVDDKVYMNLTGADAFVVQALINLEELQWVEELAPPSEDANDGVRRNIELNKVPVPPLTGKGVTIAVFEEAAIDGAHVDFRPTDSNQKSRVALPAVAPPRLINSHATLVAGTLAGDGSLSAGLYAGVAPDAELISMSRNPEALNLTRNKDALRSDLSRTPASISNNSWGIPLVGEYGGTKGASARDYDRLVRGEDPEPRIPLTAVFAVQNKAGTSLCPSRHGCITVPSTAKNAIGVGAVHVGVVSMDDDTMYEKGGWGPTLDGRIKPDLVAPGCRPGLGGGIVSTIPVRPGQPGYGVFCGTSMATPAVAGAAALLHQEFSRIFRRPPVPSSLKALLVQGAVDLVKEVGRKGADGPDYTTGFGRIDISASVTGLRAREILEAAIDHGAIHTYQFLVLPGTPKVKATLAWDDSTKDCKIKAPKPPKAPPTGTLRLRCLENDLDLVLIDPNGVPHYPWLLDPDRPGEPATQPQVGGAVKPCRMKFTAIRTDGADTSCDYRNNIEVVEVGTRPGEPMPVPGPWTAQVVGFNLPSLKQVYSLAGVGEPNIKDLTGKAHGVGRGTHGAVDIVGTFTLTREIDFGASGARVTLRNVLNEANGSGEAIGDLPLVLEVTAHNATGATFRTPPGARPSALMLIRATNGEFNFRLKIDRATAIAPSQCPATTLSLSFEIDDGLPTARAATMARWQCFDRGITFEYLKTP